MTKRNYLSDIQNSLVLTTIKSGWIRVKYDVKDSDNNQIGIVNQKVIARGQNWTMKNPNGDEILTFKGPGLLRGNLEINSKDGKNIAKFSVKQNKVKLSTGKEEQDNLCILQIIDSDLDRKILLGMFISCLSSYLDFSAASYD